jgi:hypothetical protein
MLTDGIAWTAHRCLIGKALKREKSGHRKWLIDVRQSRLPDWHVQKFVMLNLFQHPISRRDLSLKARWMLNQVQHDDVNGQHDDGNG